MSRPRLLPGLLALLLLAACEKPVPSAAEPPRPVRSVIVAPQSSGTVLTLPASVRPRVETRYGFRIAGKIASRSVSVGDTVKAGQQLARLDPQDLAPVIAAARAQRDAADTDLRLSRIDLERVRSLRERDYVSQAQVDRQQAA
ncbi:MAG TPA: biotin/lipoyl-binding protein, partial [Burkholderiaceae bacterium]|nr:biotin/lipoyl-binding protein [Burkholderiaceae bacterium]